MPEQISAADARLAALLDTLLPGSESWPGAGELGLAGPVVERLDMAEGHADALGRLLDALPEEFVGASPDAREELLRAHQTSADFGAVLLVVYDAYYVNERVVSLLEERCGYVTRPPQPEGFQLAPFDESRLERARQRQPFWRQA